MHVIQLVSNMKNLRYIFNVIIVAMLATLPLLTLNAQSASEFLPCDQYNSAVFDACSENVNDQVTNLIRAVISLVFIAIILYGIFLIIKAALTIIRSNGDPAQIESGAGIIRSVYIGIGIIFIGIIGLIVVIALLGASSVVNVNVNAPGNTVIPLITN